MSRKILVGSSAFFNEIEGFQPKDRDYVILVSNPVGFNYSRQTSFPDKYCLFEWKKMTAEEFIEYTLQTKLPMVVGKFLVPEFNKEIGFTIEHLKKLEPVFERLDKNHQYEKIIYDSYIENNCFKLTEEQRSKAYKKYAEERQIS